MRESTKTAIAIVALIALAGAFWLLLISPKMNKASELSEKTEAISGEVAAEQQRAQSAAVAKKGFPRDYEQLVLLGKAVPAEAATPSLLVQLGGVGAAAHTHFSAITQGEGGEAEGAPESAEGAALLPIGATVGPAGLSSMPYKLEFEGGFFQIADFIHGLDSLVETEGEVDAHGRLITIDGFHLAPATNAEEGLPSNSGLLTANFSVSTYVTPPGQGLTAGATAAGPSTTTPNLP